MTARLPRIVVVGAGFAGLELLLALRELAGDRVQMTLVAPEADFVVRPKLIAEPFGLGVAQRLPLSQIAADAGCELVSRLGDLRRPGSPGRRVAGRRHAAL